MMSRSCLLGLLGLAALLWACSSDCAEIKDRARTMVEEAARCDAEQSCVMVSIYDLAGGNNCLLDFQCDQAFGASVDLDAFEKEAKDLVESFRSCGECVSAGCMVPEAMTAQCDVDRGLCELVPEDGGP